MKKINFSILISFVFLTASFTSSHAQKSMNWKNVRVLVYTKNGKGYVHENIPSAVNCIQKLGKQYGFKVDTSREASIMTENNLKQYSLLIFPSTNNDVFDTDAQRLAFRRYIEAGGGFVGLHSVTGTERNWKWFKMMLGGTFAWHANFQKFTAKVIDPSHPSMVGLPKVWERADECYFAKELYPGPRVLAVHDITTLNTRDTVQKNLIIKNAGGYSDMYPSVWYYDYDGGHTWVTVYGHDKKDYSDPVYVKHVLQGIQYVASKVKARNFSKAYADSRDTPLRY
ncbi:MAG: Crp/Fnr family transcription regulator [Segetibacter sp.]|jgi:type 1 glutamine amidotransferase|nr:Crp/Fnr family transcription regulator [Segetibacter sp.]